MLTEEFESILAGVIDTIHRRTAGYDRVMQHGEARPLHMTIATVMLGAKVLSAIDRAMTMAVCFTESDGHFTHRKGGMAE